MRHVRFRPDTRVPSHSNKGGAISRLSSTMLKRDFLNMDELVEKWIGLGNKTQPKPPAPKGKRTGTTRKGPTAEEELARTQITIENRIKDEEEQ